MKPAPFDYARPATIAEACALLAEAGGGGAIIAGGQTLMPLLNLRMAQPFVVVDLGAIADLSGIQRTDTGIRIGAMTRQSDALRDPLLAQALPLVVTALGHVGHQQTRNRGTIGGSIAFGEPAAEMPATMLALGASLCVQSIRGQRVVPMTQFYFGPYATALEQDEVITAIDIPAWPADHIPLFREVARRPGDFALVGLSGVLAIEQGRIARAGLAWMAMGPTPVRMNALEAALIGADPATLDVTAMASLALAETAPFDDKAASAEYRRTVAAKLFVQTLHQALGTRIAA